MEWSERTKGLVRAARDEDLGDAGDLTSRLLPQGENRIEARVVPRQAGVVCGLELGPLICEVFAERLGTPLEFRAADNTRDGTTLEPGTTAAVVSGPYAGVLTTERTLLNFLGRMSGVATLTRAFVTAAKCENPTVEILDTRKTIPGWRELDKYAVRAAGGANHRIGLFDAVLIKDNHLAGVDLAGLADHLRQLLARIDGTPTFVEVEVDALDQFEIVAEVPGVDMILLDNFTNEQLIRAVRRRDALGLRGKLLLEASGGVNLETIKRIAGTGVDRISVGALTHSAVNLDLGLDR